MSKAFSRIKTELTPFDTLPFGKYQGVVVHDLINKDSKYLNWLIENSNINFSMDVHTLLYDKEYDTFTNFIENGQNIYDEDVPF